VSAPRQSATVTRTYKRAPDDCARALAILLKAPVQKKADKPAPEPIGRDAVRESNGYDAFTNSNK
jgi:hypothetical protein